MLKQSPTFKQRLVNLKNAFVAEMKAQANVWVVFKQEMSTAAQGFKSGQTQAEFKSGVAELGKLSNYNLGLKSQDLQNGIKVDRFKDRSRTFANGRKYGFIRTWANRWDKRVKPTQLLRVQGQIVPKLGTVNVNGVYYPPRLNRA